MALRSLLSGAVSGEGTAWDGDDGVEDGVENSLGEVVGVGAREPGALEPEADDEPGPCSGEGVSTSHTGLALWLAADLSSACCCSSGEPLPPTPSSSCGEIGPSLRNS